MRPATADIGVSSGRSPGVGSIVSYATPLTPRLISSLPSSCAAARWRYVKRRRSFRISANSGAIGSLTFTTMSVEPQISSREATIFAPALTYASSGIDEPRPAPCSIITVWPRAVRIATPDGVMPTRYS